MAQRNTEDIILIVCDTKLPCTYQNYLAPRRKFTCHERLDEIICFRGILLPQLKVQLFHTRKYPLVQHSGQYVFSPWLQRWFKVVCLHFKIQFSGKIRMGSHQSKRGYSERVSKEWQGCGSVGRVGRGALEANKDTVRKESIVVLWVLWYQ